MKLYEFEGKQLLAQAGLVVPQSQHVTSTVQLDQISHQISCPVMVKAQVLSGKRAKRGLVLEAKNPSMIVETGMKLLGTEVDGEIVESLLIEKKEIIKKEYYLSITYSTYFRGPVLHFGLGGISVEEKGGIESFALDPLLPITKQISSYEKNLPAEIVAIATSLLEIFYEHDLFLAEINPLAQLQDGRLMALDAKIITDDAAQFRKKHTFTERNVFGKQLTPSEIAAKAIDATDHRGVVGRVYIDLPGNIGILTAGGGASLVAMDALISLKAQPANYTEFSGNPPREKVAKLTQIVLSKQGLIGALLVGGKANFTDQYETLSGFLDGLFQLDSLPSYPIVIRRDGPRMKEAKAMLLQAAQNHHLNLKIYDESTSIIESVEQLVKMVNLPLGDFHG